MIKFFSNTAFMNTTCTEVIRTGPGNQDWSRCGEGVYLVAIGDTMVIRMNTPFCEKHASKFHASRMRDLEASMGN
jgi:hypothetical protein